MGTSVLLSRGAGFILGIDCALLLLPVCRNLITFLRSSNWLNRVFNFEENLYFHRWVAYALMIFTVVHVNAHYANFYIVEYQLTQAGLGTAIDIHYRSWAGITGHGMILIMVLMYTAVKHQVKQKNFELFWYSHHLFIPFYFLMFFHAFGCFVKSADTGKCKSYNTNYYLVPIFAYYLGERVWRWYRGNLFTKVTNVVFHSGNTLEIRFEKPSFKYKPGQYLFINIPSISKFQWHPYTISSTPEEKFVSIHLRIVGDWTREVADLMQKYKNNKMENSIFPKIKIDGPYGAPSEDLYNYKVAMLIGAGIGVTPAASLLKSVWYRYYHKKPMPLSKLYFYWLNRDVEAFSWFQSLLATLEETVPSSKLEIHTYLTGQQNLDNVQNISCNWDEDDDPVTRLKSRTRYGRPEWKMVFGNVEKECRGVKEVGVFYCGAGALGKQLVQECKRFSSRKCAFVFRKEKF